MTDINYRVSSVHFNGLHLERQSKGVRRRFLNRVGGAVRKTAKRSLRKARKIRVSELPDEAKEEYREDMAEWKAGVRKAKPVLRDIISKPGDPPLLHQTKSPLKVLLKYKTDKEARSVVIGPERAKDGIAGALEFGRGRIKRPRPFMGPAFRKLRPRFPEYLRTAISKG